MPTAITTIIMAQTIAQTPTQPAIETCLNVRSEAPRATMMAAQTAKTTVHVPCSDMALNEMLEERIPDATRKMKKSYERRKQRRILATPVTSEWGYRRTHEVGSSD